jgi:hypothetical protein
VEKNMKRLIISFVVIAAMFAGVSHFQTVVFSQTKPYSIGQILRAISSANDGKVSFEKIVKDVRSRGVNFPLTAETETLLRNDGAADLIIEVISPESVIRDTQDKFEEYESAGVKEYWIIDPNRRTANFYGYDENGKYKLLHLSAEGIFKSRVIEGIWIKTDWLWQEELPNLIDILKDWELV